MYEKIEGQKVQRHGLVKKDLFMILHYGGLWKTIAVAESLVNFFFHSKKLALLPAPFPNFIFDGGNTNSAFKLQP